MSIPKIIFWKRVADELLDEIRKRQGERITYGQWIPSAPMVVIREQDVHNATPFPVFVLSNVPLGSNRLDGAISIAAINVTGTDIPDVNDEYLWTGQPELVYAPTELVLRVDTFAGSVDIGIWFYAPIEEQKHWDKVLDEILADWAHQRGQPDVNATAPLTDEDEDFYQWMRDRGGESPEAYE